MRLKEDNTSWKSGGIKRRMYRQAPLTPEEETSRHKSVTKKYKKKHVHTFKSRVVGRQTVYRHYQKRDGGWERYEYDVDKTISVCTSCGYKLAGRGW